MATQIYNDSTQILCVNTVDNTKIVCLDLFTFAFKEHATDVYILEDASGTGIKVRLADAQDDEGNTFATSADLVTYLSGLTRNAANLGTNVRLDNIELSNTGSHLKMVNLNTGEQSFMVQQRVDANLGTTSVYYVEQTSEVQHETSADAYQPYSIHTGSGTANASGRYALPIDIQVIQNTFVHEYRSILNTNIENLNIKIFNVTQSPDNIDDYRVLAGTGIVAGWYISKRPYWTLNKQATIDTGAGQLIASGNAALPFDEGFSLTSGEFYRFVISGDNNFEFQGVDGAPNPFGGTQFTPYIERSFTGEVEVNVKTEGAKTHTTAIDFYRDGTDTTIILSDGESYPVNTIRAIEDSGTIKIISVDTAATITHYKQINHELVTIAGSSAGTTATGVVNALNALFAVQPLGLGGDYVSTLPTLAGVDITANFAEGQDPIGDSVYGVSSDTSQHGARVWSTETIDETGEFYEVKITGKGQFMLGLYSVDDGDLTEITNNTGSGHSGYKWANAFYNYGSYIAPWTTYGSNSGLSYGPGWNGATTAQMRYNTIVQDNLENANPANPVLFKVGINAQGYIAVYYFDEGRSNQYIMTARSTYTLPAGQYGLMVKLVNGAVQLAELPTRTAVDPTAPILTYHYIESPDGVFHYPVFSSAEEANYYDLQNGGTGSGSSHTHIYVDDPTNTVWYMPDNGSTMAGTSAPASTSEITYNVIATEADSLHVPAAFSDQTITVNEGEALNLQLHPTGNTAFTTTIGGIPAFTLVNGYLQGTAPEVTGDNVANPSDTTTVTVYRTNVFGTSQGTLTININNLTAPVNPISGFNHVSGTTALIDSDTLGDGSVVHVNTQVADGERFVIEQAYIETNILPNLTGANDMYIIGLHNTASDFSTLELADFDAAIVWEYETVTSHTFKFYRDGSVVQNIVINSLTDAFYDYAIEANGTSAWLIACNVNSIMNEPSPADGGSFSHTYEVTNAEDTAPLQIHIAALNTTADISTTDIETITTPAAPVSNLTNWTKALDFSGSSEHLKQVSQSTFVNALRMGGKSSIVPANSDSTKTADNSNSSPWATAIVFNSDGNNSNQHIWNSGEGTSSGSDNIYLRLSSTGQLYFGWGRDGVGYNEKQLATVLGNNWYGVYIAHNGTRLSGSNATAANLDAAFDIRVARPNDITNDVGADQYLVTPSGYWTSTGSRMDRSVTGDFTIGGRGSNRNFHGKVASMVITTLRSNFAMPTDAEIKLMITDPKKWEDDYRVGQFVRWAHATSITTYNPSNFTYGYGAVQIWLMGDGTNDSYSNGIRNQVYPTDQNYTKLQFNSMVSNDIETVNITGLS